MFGRNAIREDTRVDSLTLDIASPSGIEKKIGEGSPATTTRDSYAEPIELVTDARGTALGNLLHRCFEILGACPDAHDAVANLLSIAGDNEIVSAVEDHVAAFEMWLKTKYSFEVAHREWPVLCLRDDGSVLSGTIDLVVRRGDDVWIIDHKSDQLTDRAEGLGRYIEQLSAYAQALTSQGLTVRGVGVNWIRYGDVEMMGLVGD